VVCKWVLSVVLGLFIGVAEDWLYSVVLSFCRRGLRLVLLSGPLLLYAWFENGCAQWSFVIVGVV